MSDKKKKRARKRRVENELRRKIAALAALDSTSLTKLNERYYNSATGGAADLTLDRQTRSIAQNRCEYEFLNEPIAFGAALKTSALTIGLGPTLKIVSPIPDAEPVAQRAERLFASFADAIELDRKLRLIAMELVYHGEIFLRKVCVDNRFGAPGFDYVLVRPERVGNPFQFGEDPCVYDGVRYDRPGDGGTPVSYFLRRENANPTFVETLYDEIPSDEFIHVFEPILPQQHRGLPPLQSGLPRLAQLRQLIASTLKTMTNAAKLGIILTTDNADILESASREGELRGYGVDSDAINFDGDVAFSPPGYEPKFGDAKHPASGFAEIKRMTAADVGSALGVGSGKINNDHSSYNFSSAKMDEQIDFTLVQVRQRELSRQILDPIFNDWLAESARCGDRDALDLVAAYGVPERVERRWYWREPRSIDTLKDAQSAQILVNAGLMTREEYWARRGKDSKEETPRWIGEQKQIAPYLPPNAAPAAVARSKGETDLESVEPTD